MGTYTIQPINYAISGDLVTRSATENYGEDKVAATVMKAIVFPANMRQEKNGRPFIMFSAVTDNFAVFLPMPPALVINDQAQYSTVDLGIIGAAAVDAYKKANIGNGAAGNPKPIAALSSLGKSALNSVRSTNAAAALGIAMKSAGFADTGKIIDFAAGQVANPSTNTTFDAMAVRTFQFGFKLIAKNIGEANAIESMVMGFREYMYPESTQQAEGGVLLKFPSKWSIGFFTESGARNTHLPGIADCYLKEFTTTFNESTNAFHKDGVPIEVSISVGFQECRALTRSDIQALQQ